MGQEPTPTSTSGQAPRTGQAPTIHPDALTLAELLRPTWPARSAALHATGVPTCEGEPAASTPPAANPPATSTPPESTTPPAEPKTYDADYVRKLRDEAAARRTEANELKTRLQQFEDRDKSDLQKATERAERAEREATEAKTASLRIKVGQSKGLPIEVAELLHGDNEKDMTAHADRLIKAGIAGGQQRTTFDGGTRQQAPPAGGMDALIRAAAGRG
jgi:hypothetical protein